MSKGDDSADFEKWWNREHAHLDRASQAIAWAAWQARGQQEPLTDARIDEAIMSCPGEGYALMAAGKDVTVAEFRAIVRAWARAILKAAHE